MDEHVFVIIDDEGDVNSVAETEERAQQIIDEREGDFDYIKAMFFRSDEYKGSNFVETVPGITLGCITPEARALLDTIVDEYKKHCDNMIESGLECETPDDVYGAFYWLVRWSELVQPANLPNNDMEPDLKPVASRS